MYEASDYPLTDEQGYYWFDPITFLSQAGYEPCFVCGNLTKRVDVCFEAFYCGSYKCDKQIRDDLEEANKKLREDWHVF